MKNAIINAIMSLLTVDNICKLIGFGLGRLLMWARKKDCWDQLKAIVHKVRGWLDVIDQVIEDDNLSEDEEAMIAEALKNTKAIAKIEEIIKTEEVKQ